MYVPITARYTSNEYTFRLTIPYILLTAPANTVQTGKIILSGTGAISTDSGIGDVIAGVTYHDAVNTEATSDLAIDFTAKLKLGTAEENKGLGSGENDYTFLGWQL